MSNPQKEIRTSTTHLRAEAATAGGPGKISGYAAVFNVLSHRIPQMRGARERLMRGCFAASLKRGDEVGCYIGHDPERVLGRTRNNMLQLREDDTGLFFSCELPDTQEARDLYTLVKRGDLGECSFGFTNAEDDWDNERDPETGEMNAVRTVRSATVFDVSVVGTPCYPGTSVGARNMRSTDYSIRLASAADLEAEKKTWRDAFDLQMKRDGF